MENLQLRNFDSEMILIADYVCDYKITSPLAFETAKYCLMDSLGCAMLALNFPACTKLLGPIVDGTSIQKGVKIPGTTFELDPVQAAFNLGTMIRWLDYNDTWLAKEWAHPSDNLGALISVMDFTTRRQDIYHQQYTVKDLLDAMIRAYEIQGIFALENSFNAQGLDHVILVKLASCALATRLLGGTKDQILHALSQVWVDGQSLRTYRHAPNTGSRKSWAAGDATSRAVQLALYTLKGEKGYPSAISAARWGFSDVLFAHKPLKIAQSLGSYVMENILFKIAYPAEFHAQTAVECAINLHEQTKNKLAQVEKIVLYTQQAGMRIINKIGPLHNPADRDHCLQYMVAYALIFGNLTAQAFEDSAAADPKIDGLREKMVVMENPLYSQDYLDPSKRSIANSVEIFFTDGTHLKQAMEYPLGHARRRQEGIPLLWKKFEQNIASRFKPAKVEQLLSLMQDDKRLERLTVSEFIEQWH